MSYEGYSQFLCRKGHYWTEDCYLADIKTSVCPICKGKAIWENMVDVTNGSFDEKGIDISGYINLKEKSVNKCKHCNSTLETTYYIPPSRKRKK